MAQAGLIIPTSGAYLGTWNALPMGVQGDDGFELECTVQGQEVNASDAYGMTLCEVIYRGQNWKMRTRGLEWNKTGLLGALQMFGQTGSTSTLTPTLANIGNRSTLFGQALILTAILANPPSIPQTLTALSAILSANSRVNMNFTSKLREMPLEWSLLPYASVSGSVTSNIPFSST